MNEKQTPFLINNDIIEKCQVQLLQKYIYQDMIDKLYHMKNLHELVRRLNRVDDKTLLTTHGFCTEVVKRITDYSFITINEPLSSIHNLLNLIELKKREKLTRLYGQIYTNFDEFPPYSYSLSDIFETKINSNLQCFHEYPKNTKSLKNNTWVDAKT